MFRPWRENFQALFVRTPLQNVDINVSDAPTLHLEAGIGEQVDRVCSDERAAVVVDDILLIRADQAKTSAERKTRPIGSRTDDIPAGKVHTNGIVFSASATF